MAGVALSSAVTLTACARLEVGGWRLEVPMADPVPARGDTDSDAAVHLQCTRARDLEMI